MDPNNPQTNPQEPTPQAVTAPNQVPHQPPIVPSMPSAPITYAPVPTFAQPAPTTPIATPTPPKRGIGKILAIVGVIVLVIIAAIVVLGLMGLPAIQSKAKANEFMANITTGNVDKAVEISGDASNKEFLTTASTKVKGSYKQIESQYKVGKGYYLYELSGADSKYARVTTEKAGGKLVVSTFVFSNTKLALVPGTSTTTEKSSTVADTSSCLVKTDFNTIEQANNGGNGVGNIDYSKPSYIGTYLSGAYVGIVYYLPDSLNFDTQNDIAGYTNASKVASFAAFYKANSSKQFTFHIEGVVALNDQASLEFGTQRASKVKNTLIAQGVPADRIVVDAPQNISTYGSGVWKGQESDPTAKRLSRSVSISVIPPDTCLQGGTGR